MPTGEPTLDRASVRVFPPAIPLATILAGIVLERVVPLTRSIGWPAWTRIAGAAVIVGSIAVLGAWSVLLIRKSGQSENPWKPTTRIIADGPYRVTRNPMYLQMVLVCVGSAMVLHNLWILILTPLCALALQQLAIRPEEEYLERKFGDEYLQYRVRVRRWL